MGKRLFKLKVFFLLSFFFIFSAQSKDDTYVQNTNTTNVNTDTFAEGECKCGNFFGNKLKECLSYLSKEELKKHFYLFSGRTLQRYLISLNLLEYKELLTNWSEEEWLEMWESFDPEKKQKIPRTKIEQLDIINSAESKLTAGNVLNGGYILAKAGVTVVLTGGFGIPLAGLNLFIDAKRLNNDAEEEKPQRFEKLKEEYYHQNNSRPK